MIRHITRNMRSFCCVFFCLGYINSLAPERCSSDLKNVITKDMLQIRFMSTYCDIAFMQILQNIFDYKPLVQVIARWNQAALHYLIQMLTQIYAIVWCHLALMSYKFFISSCNVFIIFVQVTSLAVGKCYDCPSTREVTLKDQGPLLLTWFNFNPSMDK